MTTPKQRSLADHVGVREPSVGSFRIVVENSLHLGKIEIQDGDKKQHIRLMRDSMLALAAPI